MMVDSKYDWSSRRSQMRKVMLVLGCCCLLAGPAWAGGGLHLFGTYGELNDFESSAGAGGRFSIGGESLVLDLTVTWFPERNGKVVDEGGVVVFDDLQLAPIELGVRYVFGGGGSSGSGGLRPYIGAGASFMVADLDTGAVDDEIGYYGLFGAVFGNGVGIDFFAEVLYRQARVTVDYGFQGSWKVDVGGLAGSFGIVLVF
jgi:hypothetical protein